VLLGHNSHQGHGEALLALRASAAGNQRWIPGGVGNPLSRAEERLYYGQVGGTRVHAPGHPNGGGAKQKASRPAGQTHVPITRWRSMNAAPSNPAMTANMAATIH